METRRSTSIPSTRLSSITTSCPASSASTAFTTTSRTKNRRQRERDIRKTYQPSLSRRVARTLRNVLTTFREAIVQSLNADPRRPRRRQPTERGPDQAQRPDRQRRAVDGKRRGQRLRSDPGALCRAVRGARDADPRTGFSKSTAFSKEYSSQYIELLNARVEVPLYIYLRRRPRYRRQAGARQARGPGGSRVAQPGASDHRRDALRGRGRARSRSVAGARAAHRRFRSARPRRPGRSRSRGACAAWPTWSCPRTTALVRHAGKQEKLSWDEWLGLDDLPSLPWLKRLVRARRDASAAVDAEGCRTDARISTDRKGSSDDGHRPTKAPTPPPASTLTAKWAPSTA